MSLFVCAKCGCVDNTATSDYWCLTHLHDKIKMDYCPELLQYKGKALCSECGFVAHKGDISYVVPGRWHGKFPKELASKDELRKVSTNGLIEF